MPRRPRAAKKTAAPAPVPRPAAILASFPRTLIYADLKARSEAYDGEVWETIDDLYTGGFQLKKNAKKYLPRLVREAHDRWKDRVACTAYINYFGQIVDYFTSALFGQEIVVREAPDADDDSTPGEKADSPFYAEFAKDADGKDTTIAELFKTLMTTALKKRRALLAIDLPMPMDGIETRADEDARGAARAYAYELPLEQVIDWDDDDDGGFRYLVIHRLKKRKAPPGQRKNVIVEEFKIWEKFEPSEPEDSALDFQPDADDTKPIVTWRLYRVEYAENKPPKENAEIPIVDSGVVSFQRIPILQMDVPEGLWVGNKIALMQLEHYQGRSALNAAENRSLIAVPVVQHGNEAGSPGGPTPSVAQQNPQRGKRRDLDGEVVTLGTDDKYGFWEPKGDSYTIKHEQLTALKDELFRVSHQMAMSISNSARQVARSGESKAQDRVAEGLVLGALGQIVRKFGVRVNTTISEARGEDVVWVAHGLDNYDTEDREQLLEEAVALDQVPIGSPTFKKFHKVQIAQRLCKNMAPQTQDQMRKEIEDSVDAEEEIRVDVSEAEGDAKIATAKAKAADPTGAKAAALAGGAIRGPKTPKVPAVKTPGGGGARAAAP